MYVVGPTGVPQYYSPQPPWGIYLAAPMHPQQQQQDGGQLQQLLRNRPMSPQSGPEPTAQIQSQGYHCLLLSFWNGCLHSRFLIKKDQ